MSIPRTPKTSELKNTIIDQLQAAFNQRIPLLPQSFNRVLSAVLAGVFVTLYKYAGVLALQYFPRFATNAWTTINGKRFQPLTEWGRLIGEGDPTPATRAEFTITITVNNQTGSIPSGEQLTNTDNGVIYLLIGTVVLDAATKTATIRAEADQSGGTGAGAIGNMAVGATVSFVNPLPNVEQNAVVTSQDVVGVDGETDEAYRARVVDRFQRRPQGGAAADYNQWGRGVEGVVDTYPYTGDPGEVDLYSEATPESSGSEDGFPTSAQLTAVFNATQLDDAGLATRRPIDAFVNSYSILRDSFDVEVTGLSGTDLTTTEAKITEGVEQYFKDRAPHISGLTPLPRRDRVSTPEVSGVVANVASAYGATFTSVIVKESAVSIQLWQLGVGTKAKAASVTYL
jgi:uncharacterized phage protein gp47/JayE